MNFSNLMDEAKNKGYAIVVKENLVKVFDAQARPFKQYNVEKSGELSEISGVPSYPPAGYLRVTNLYVEPGTNKLIVDFDDTPS